MAIISIEIPDNKIQTFWDAFKVAYPKPIEFEGTNVEWIKEFLLRKLYRCYNIGRRQQFDSEIDIT